MKHRKNIEGKVHTIVSEPFRLSDYVDPVEEGLTMKDMSGEEYKGIDDVNVRLDGWLIVMSMGMT